MQTQRRCRQLPRDDIAALTMSATHSARRHAGAISWLGSTRQTTCRPTKYRVLKRPSPPPARGCITCLRLDLNPIEMPYAKFKAYLRKLAERTVPGLHRTMRSFLASLKPSERASYLRMPDTVPHDRNLL
jgi:hypothetical protein